VVTGSSTGSDGMPRYSVSVNGNVLALKPKNLIPIAVPEDSGGGMGGMGGMPGMPNMQQVLNQLPPWFKEKMQRGERPSFADVQKLLGLEVSTSQLTGLGAVFLLLFWKAGILKALLVTVALGCALVVGAGAYGRAGGKVAGLKAAARAVSAKVAELARAKAGYELTPTQAALVAGALGLAVVAVCVQALAFSGGSRSAAAELGGAGGGYGYDDAMPSTSRPTLPFGQQLQGAYDQGYGDGERGGARQTMTYEAPEPRSTFKMVRVTRTHHHQLLHMRGFGVSWCETSSLSRTPF
jgi:hypothetical protein